MNMYNYFIKALGVPTEETFNNLVNSFPPALESDSDIELAFDDIYEEYTTCHVMYDYDTESIQFSDFGIERLFYAFFLYSTFLEVLEIDLKNKTVELEVSDIYYDDFEEDNRNYSEVIEGLNKVNDHLTKYGWTITNYNDLLNNKTF